MNAKLIAIAKSVAYNTNALDYRFIDDPKAAANGVHDIVAAVQTQHQGFLTIAITKDARTVLYAVEGKGHVCSMSNAVSEITAHIR